MVVLQEFLARMGHELRTPLHAIVGFLDLAEDQRKEDGAEVGDYLRNARVSALTLLDLINNLLDLARMERGELELDATPFRVDDLMDEVTRTLSPQAHMKGLELEYLVDAGVGGPVTGDPIRIKQVLFNLAGNAVKFTSQGHVLLRAGHPAKGAPGEVRFSVTDTGRGIPESMRERIFQSYVRVRHAGIEDIPGVGLGLAISHQLVEAMGGKIDLRSELGEGSEFAFTLNLPPAEEDVESAPPDGPSLHGASILLIHPEDFGRAVFGEKLKAQGVTVIPAGSVAEGEERLRAAEASGEPLRLALVDIGCGMAEAASFARSVREETGRFQPDLVLMVPMGRFQDEERMTRAGFTGVLTKPVNAEEMRRYLGSLIARQTSAGAPLGGQTADQGRRGGVMGSKGSILVVEDNAVSQKLLQAFLGKQGFQVTVASNGFEGVEAVANRAFDLVLMDLQMPEMDGLTATRRIREMEEGKDIPIIAMTAATLKGDRERCLEAGMSGFSPKPILPNALLKLIHAWLERTGAGPLSAMGTLPGDLRELADLDLNHLESVYRYLQPHDPARFEGFVSAFVQDLTTLLAELVGAHDTAGIGGSQADASLQALHKIRGLCEGFGAPRLGALAQHLASDQAGMSHTAWNEGVDAFRREAEGLMQRLRQPLFPP